MLVQIRLAKFERKNWRISYNSLIVLEHLLTHGPESTAEEFQGDKEAIVKMQGFQYIDEKGFVLIFIVICLCFYGFLLIRSKILCADSIGG